MAQLIAEADGKRTFLFWNGTQRTFPESHWKLMQPVGGGAVEAAAPAASATPRAPDATDLRALQMQTRILGDTVTSGLFAKAIAEQPDAGMVGNTGYHLVRDVLQGWLVGERDHVAKGLARAIELLEHARSVGERFGDPSVFYAARQAEALPWRIG